MNQFNDPSAKNRHRISWQHAAGLGLVLWSSSCSSASKYVKSAFSSDPAAAMAKADAAEEAAELAAEKRRRSEQSQSPAVAAKKGSVAKTHAGSAVVQAGTTQQNTPATSSSGEQLVTNADGRSTARPGSDTLQMISRGEDPFANSESPAIAQASAEIPAKASTSPIQHEPEARVPISIDPATAPVAQPSLAEICPPVGPSVCMPATTCLPNTPQQDEYVCDGGDKGLPVHYEAGNRAGLEVEDTIAEYQTEDGKTHVKPSTKACIYAPRFGEVRSATLPQEELTVEKAQGHQDQRAVSGMNAKMVTGEKIQADEPQGMRAESRASGLKAKESDGQVAKAIGAQNQTKLVNAFEDYRFVQEGQFDRVTAASLDIGINAALEWADGRRPVIVAQDRSGQILQSHAAAREYVGVEDRRTPAELKIVKVADKSFAHPGDLVTFTIRFDNIGGKDLLQVRVVDNLSPRLVYVQGSIESNLDGGIDVVDNGQGGELLTFEFDHPLKGKTGGFITFKCRVR